MVAPRGSEEYRLAQPAREKKYQGTPRGKAVRKKYDASPKGKAAAKKYEASPKAKAAVQKRRSGDPEAWPAGANKQALDRLVRKAKQLVLTWLHLVCGAYFCLSGERGEREGVHAAVRRQGAPGGRGRHPLLPRPRLHVRRRPGAGQGLAGPHLPGLCLISDARGPWAMVSCTGGLGSGVSLGRFSRGRGARTRSTTWSRRGAHRR